MTQSDILPIGLRIRQIRQYRGLTQEELAFRAKIDTSYLGQIERQKCSPSYKILAAIAAALDMTLTLQQRDGSVVRFDSELTTTTENSAHISRLFSQLGQYEQQIGLEIIRLLHNHSRNH